MKKALISGFLGIAFAFAMVACNGSAKNNDSVADNEQPACEQAEEHQCMHHCQMTCPDSVCLAANCENCTCPEDSPCHKKAACQGDSTCHKDAACADKKDCCKKQQGEGCCKKQQGEGCKKECENHKN